MRISHDTHVLVADGRKFLLLRNEGDETLPNLVIESHAAQDDAATRDIGTDKPGRTFTGTAGHGAGAPDHRSGYEQTDYHQQAEDNFAKLAIERLRPMLLDGRLTGLIVAAPPNTLGELRKHYDKHLEAVLIGEIAKELTNRTTIEIADMIAAS